MSSAARKSRRAFADRTGDVTPARNDVPVPQPLPCRAQQRERIHAGVPAEEAVLIGQHRRHIARRHLCHPHRVPPDVRTIGKGPQRRTVAGEDDLGVGREVGGVGRRTAAGERGREELVGEEERRKASSKGDIPTRFQPNTWQKPGNTIGTTLNYFGEHYTTYVGVTILNEICYGYLSK